MCINCSFCCFLKFASLNIFCVGELRFFYPLNSLNRVRICAGTPYIAPRDLQKQDSVIARFWCYSTNKLSGHCMKFCQILSTHDFLVICLRCRTDVCVASVSLHMGQLRHDQLRTQMWKKCCFEVMLLPKCWKNEVYGTIIFLWETGHDVLCHMVSIIMTMQFVGIGYK